MKGLVLEVSPMASASVIQIWPTSSELLSSLCPGSERNGMLNDGGQAFENFDAAGVLASNVPLHRFG